MPFAPSDLHHLPPAHQARIAAEYLAQAEAGLLEDEARLGLAQAVARELEAKCAQSRQELARLREWLGVFTARAPGAAGPEGG